MSISKIQYNTKKEEFKQELLKKGIEPNNYELNNLLSEFFDNKTLGMPYYAPIKQEPYETSNREAYNYTFKALGQDMQTIYDANIEANNKAVAIQEYYDTEKTKVMNAIQKLSLRVQNINEIMNSSIAGKQYVQVFDDLYDVEYYGDSERNIPYTTAFIDLLQKKMYTEKSNTKINKINISNSDIKITGIDKFKKRTTEGELSNILTDTIDSVYTVVCKSDKNQEMEISIIIDLKSLMDINTVLFSFTSSRQLKCELSLSEDGENYINVHDITGTNLIEWNFPTKTIQYIKINIIKSEADGYGLTESNTEYYEYYYILKNISVALETFESKSVFVSKKIEFDDLVNSITLNVTDRIYNDTRIDYFIGFDNGDNKVGWDSIENHKAHDLFMFEKKNKILNYHLKDSNDFGEMEPAATELYKLYKIPNTVNRNSIKITPGYNMWSVIRYQKKDDQEYDESFSFNSFDFTEYTDKCTANQLFMDCENYTSFKLHPNTLYVFTQYVSLEQSTNVYDKYIRVMDTASANVVKNTQQKVFINGLEVSKTGNDEENFYSFALKKGINKIQIVIYAPATAGAGTDRWLYHNINFKEVTNHVFAFPPMKYINWYVLDKQMEPNYKYYTIKDNYICVKCTPEDMIKSDIEDMGYFMSYYSLREDMAYYFSNNKLTFRIMAVLHSNNKNVSPEIINFRITGR